jgi:AcrR family transcriptional regulator
MFHATTSLLPSKTNADSTTDSPTRALLLAAGHDAFAESGYAGTRLADLSASAGLTTGAFYRYFANKAAFYRSAFEDYEMHLLQAMRAVDALRPRVEVWLSISREFRGVVRAAQELTRLGSEESELSRALRDACADLFAESLSSALKESRQRRLAGLMVYDILNHYAVMESAAWIPKRDLRAVAQQVERLLNDGLYI